MSQLSEAYVIGLLTDVERSAPELEAQLRAARNKAAAIDAELGNLLRRLDDSRSTLKSAQTQQARASAAINDGNMRVAQLHQEIAVLEKKGHDIKLEMDRVADERAIRRKLRRERAKITVQIEERQEEIAAVRAQVEEERARLQQAEEALAAERDRSRVLTAELDQLQGQLPSPYLYTKLFETQAARAHCRLYLDGDLGAWRAEMRTAIDWTVQLHGELRAGKYRLDKNSDLVGGRATATAEAMYGAVAIGAPQLAVELFRLATDPGLYFHQIFNVMRVWCLGLYLTGEEAQLRTLLRLHQFAEGLRGGYVGTFIGLLTNDPRRVGVGLKDITRHEWELWQDPNLVRGMGVVNLGAVALGQLALGKGLRVDLPGPTVPTDLLAPPRGATSAAIARR